MQSTGTCSDVSAITSTDMIVFLSSTGARRCSSLSSTISGSPKSFVHASPDVSSHLMREAISMHSGCPHTEFRPRRSRAVSSHIVMSSLAEGEGSCESKPRRSEAKAWVTEPV